MFKIAKKDLVIVPGLESYEGHKLRREYVKKHKLKRIGGGVFATAYTKKTSNGNSRIVYKIGTVFDYDNMHQDAYLNYLNQVVLKHQGNPFVPRVYDVKYYFTSGKKPKPLMYVVKMERLAPYTSRAPSIRQNAIVKINAGRTSYKVRELHDLSADIEERSIQVRPNTNKHFAHWWKNFKPMLRFYDADMHTGNVMFRGRGYRSQLVITDPIC